MKKTYIQPEVSVKKMMATAILANSIGVGDDYTSGDYEGRAKTFDAWDVED